MIVTVADLAAHLELQVPEDSELEALLTVLLTRVEGAFLAACGRDRPFLPAGSGVVETLDGTGSGSLFVSRPVAAVTSVAVGDLTTPRATYTAAQLYVVPGTRLIRARESGVTFGSLDEPGAVRVTYDAQADAPADAQQAILRATAALYLQRGAEDVKAESEGGVRSDFAPAFDDPSWALAVATHRELGLA